MGGYTIHTIVACWHVIVLESVVFVFVLCARARISARVQGVWGPVSDRGGEGGQACAAGGWVMGEGAWQLGYLRQGS